MDTQLKPLISQIVYLLATISVGIGSSDIYAQTSPQAVIKARKEKSGKKVIIHYKVTNIGPNPLAAFTIGTTGNDDVPDDDFYQLVVPPVGFQYSYEEHEPDILPPASVTSPSGWQVEPKRVETKPKIGLRWETVSSDNGAIQPGSTLEGFSVILPKDDLTYLKGHAAVYFTLGGSITVQIEEEIVNQPPQLSVRLHPDHIWPPNNKMVEVRAKIEAKDNSGKKPKISLVSITCNDNCNLKKDVSGAKIGSDDRVFSLRASRSGQRAREYSVTYSATDAGGLTSSQTTKIVVKHDHRDGKWPHDGPHEGSESKDDKRK